ncbi:U6 snRNA phosphodiesterase 1 [Bombina bombina]|uniref:U6 snRNA phosphodiesterase 1-like n=1 Tax=Bombina bombina TaxID=8345 RepID=UPI00235ABD71|nr:U6 snRNA phosphodiesterase 1-like [Bombina bombina]XP_053558572.1 U6 snRNA phosphodiesterase 1 [Bombina bombina]
MFQDVIENEVCDDVTKHGGRIRNFKHERGNWATYVYIPFQPREEFWDLLDELLSMAADHGVILNKMSEFHISQSQTVVLRHHWIDPFVQSLRDRLHTMYRFVCIADQIKVYTNQEKTRTFLGLEVTVGMDNLLEVVSEVDKSLQEFKLQTFYQNPSFHVSLAWCVGDVSAKLNPNCVTLLQRALDRFEDSGTLTRIYTEEIRCKSGNKTFCIPLQ